jgi:hypothetical protein
MKRLLLTALLALPACATTTDDTSPPKAIETEAAFRAAIVDRQITFEANTLTINSDNTISGPWNGDGITGTWTWEDGAFCRDIKIGGQARDPDCQTWIVAGDTATVTRNRGAGASFDYKIGS